MAVLQVPDLAGLLASSPSDWQLIKPSTDLQLDPGFISQPRRWAQQPHSLHARMRLLVQRYAPLAAPVCCCCCGGGGGGSILVQTRLSLLCTAPVSCGWHLL